jgi:hypothetical protein
VLRRVDLSSLPFVSIVSRLFCTKYAWVCGVWVFGVVTPSHLLVDARVPPMCGLGGIIMSKDIVNGAHVGTYR